MHLIHDGARVLCFSPHPDDTEFGVGATLSRFRGRFAGRIIVFSDRSQTRNEQHNERDQRSAALAVGLPADSVCFVDQLGYAASRLKVRFFGTEENRDLIRHIISRAVQDFQPDIVFIPGLRETFQDHSALAEEAVRILRGDYAILGYEVPKHNRHFQPNTFVKLDEADIAAKVAALQCFSEFTTRYYFEPDAIRSLARTRALDAGYFGLVEAFELYRLCTA
jgi:N-acetylglucosamine malate deacetylase 1